MAPKKMLISPKMIVRYAYLVTPSTTHKALGEYCMKVAIQDGTDEAEAFKALFDKLLVEQLPKATASLKPAQKAKLIEAASYSYEENSETGDETGYITWNFSMPAKVIRKSDSKEFNFNVDLFDSSGNPLERTSDLKIGSGSVVQVGFTADRAYCMEGKDPVTNKTFHKAGLSTDLKAVMIQSLADFSASATDYGFDISGEGFTQEAPVNPFNGDEAPPLGDADADDF